MKFAGNDMRDLKSLVACKDIASVRTTIHELCTGFGEISHMDILTVKQPGKRQALCFLRLGSEAQEKQLMADLGVTRFGSELLCVVDLPAEQAAMAEQRAGFRPRSDKPRRSSSLARRVLDRESGRSEKRRAS
ncbi:MAG TPA: hypothetical protein VK572_17155 [Burkholderiales bacterium]|nr:hypothetical protein [Burkholderiales bacterium]